VTTANVCFFNVFFFNVRHNHAVGTCRKMNIIKMEGKGDVSVEGHSLTNLEDSSIMYEEEPVMSGGEWIRFQIKAEKGAPGNDIRLYYTVEDWDDCKNHEMGLAAFKNSMRSKRKSKRMLKL